MAFIQFAIRNPVKVAVGVILAVMFGLISYFATPVQLTPDVEEVFSAVGPTKRSGVPDEGWQPLVIHSAEPAISRSGEGGYKLHKIRGSHMADSVIYNI